MSVTDSIFAEMPLGDHLEELRKRLTWALVGLAPILAMGLWLGRPLVELIITPAQAALRAQGLPDALIATGPMETFLTYFAVAGLFTVVLGSPWMLYQLWKFVSPGLYAHERRFVYVLIPMSSVLTVLSVLFLYFVMIPIVLSFFVGFGATLGARDVGMVALAEGVELGSVPVLAADPPDPLPGQMWVNEDIRQLRVSVREGLVLGAPLVSHTGVRQDYKISTYTQLVVTMAIGLAMAFQTPVVVLLLGWVGLIRREMLVRYRRHILMGVLVLSAVLTPSDPLSMIVLAVPMFMLFELGSILLVVLPASRVAGDEPDVGDG